MQTSDFLLWIGDPKGYHLAAINRFATLACNLGVNTVGSLQAALSPTFDESLLVEDAVIELWRRPFMSAQQLVGTFLLKSWPRGIDANGQPTINITALCVNSVLDGPIIYETGINETRTISFSAIPAAGYFTLTFAGSVAIDHIPYVDATHMPTAGDVQQQLEALSTIGPGNVTVTLDTRTYTIEFTNDLGNRNLTGTITAPDNTTGTVITISPATGAGTVDGASPVNKGDAVDSTPVPTVAADDMMKYYVRMAMTDAATDASRSLTPDGFTVQADMSQGKAIRTQHENEKVLAALQGVAQQNLQEGGRAQFFMVEQIGFQPAAFQFRTYSDQWGDNRTRSGSNPIILSVSSGTMGETVITYDYSDFMSVARVGGMGNAGSRAHVEVKDTTLLARSPWSRHEGFVDASDTSDTNVMTAKGHEALFSNRARWTFVGRLAQTRHFIFGVHIRPGDKVSVWSNGESFDARMDGYSIAVDASGVETIDAVWNCEKVGYASA